MIDPALVTLIPAPAHDLNPAGSLAVQVVGEDGNYPAGTLFVWAGVADEGEMLVLRPLHPDHALGLETAVFNNQPLHTWVEHDAGGQLDFVAGYTVADGKAHSEGNSSPQFHALSSDRRG